MGKNKKKPQTKATKPNASSSAADERQAPASTAQEPTILSSSSGNLSRTSKPAAVQPCNNTATDPADSIHSDAYQSGTVFASTLALNIADLREYRTAINTAGGNIVFNDHKLSSFTTSSVRDRSAVWLPGDVRDMLGIMKGSAIDKADSESSMWPRIRDNLIESRDYVWKHMDQLPGSRQKPDSQSDDGGERRRIMIKNYVAEMQVEEAVLRSVETLDGPLSKAEQQSSRDAQQSLRNLHNHLTEAYDGLMEEIFFVHDEELLGFLFDASPNSPKEFFRSELEQYRSRASHCAAAIKALEALFKSVLVGYAVRTKEAGTSTSPDKDRFILHQIQREYQQLVQDYRRLVKHVQRLKLNKYLGFVLPSSLKRKPSQVKPAPKTAKATSQVKRQAEVKPELLENRSKSQPKTEDKAITSKPGEEAKLKPETPPLASAPTTGNVSVKVWDLTTAQKVTAALKELAAEAAEAVEAEKPLKEKASKVGGSTRKRKRKALAKQAAKDEAALLSASTSESVASSQPQADGPQTETESAISSLVEDTAHDTEPLAAAVPLPKCLADVTPRNNNNDVDSDDAQINDPTTAQTSTIPASTLPYTLAEVAAHGAKPANIDFRRLRRTELGKTMRNLHWEAAAKNVTPSKVGSLMSTTTHNYELRLLYRELFAMPAAAAAAYTGEDEDAYIRFLQCRLWDLKCGMAARAVGERLGKVEG